MGRILAGTAVACLFATAAHPALAGDAAAGAKYFHATCAVCHGNTANSPPGVGPRLYGVGGRRSGSLPGYNYSLAMRQSGLTWTAELLNRYLTNPQALVHGNKMPFAGVPNPKDRGNVITYLLTLH